MKAIVSVQNFGSKEQTEALAGVVESLTGCEVHVKEAGVVVFTFESRIAFAWGMENLSRDVRTNWIEYTIQFEN